MPSKLEDSIRRTRRALNEIESPARRQIVELYNQTILNLKTDLTLIVQRIDQAREAGEIVNPDWLRRQARYQRLIDQAEREFERFTDEAQRVVENEQEQAVRGGAAQAWDLMEAAGIDVGFGGRINTIAVESALAAARSRPLRASLAQYGKDGAKTITDTLLDGIARGRGSRAIILDIQRGLKSPFSRARLEALVRTESARAFNTALDEQYKLMDHLIEGYRWSADKGVRTCLVCLALDGTIFEEYQHTQHVCCRCLCTPVPRGSTYQYESGEDWLRRQPEDVQRSMFPTKGAFAAFKEKKVTLNDFVGSKQSKTWGDSVTQRSWTDVKRRTGVSDDLADEGIAA